MLANNERHSLVCPWRSSSDSHQLRVRAADCENVAHKISEGRQPLDDSPVHRRGCALDCLWGAPWRPGNNSCKRCIPFHSGHNADHLSAVLQESLVAQRRTTRAFSILQFAP